MLYSQNSDYILKERNGNGVRRAWKRSKCDAAGLSAIELNSYCMDVHVCVFVCVPHYNVFKCVRCVEYGMVWQQC